MQTDKCNGGKQRVAQTMQHDNPGAFEALGLGVDPSIPDWGGMLASGQLYLTTAWWVDVFPGVALMLTVMGFNLLGDWLRDITDPLHGR